jgi:hypothetical protein
MLDNTRDLHAVLPKPLLRKYRAAYPATLEIETASTTWSWVDRGGGYGIRIGGSDRTMDGKAPHNDAQPVLRHLGRCVDGRFQVYLPLEKT